MNKKLWQAIGLQNKLSNIFEQKSEDKNEPQQTANVFNFNDLARSQRKQSIDFNPKGNYSNYNDISNQIESCQSQIVDSKYQKQSVSTYKLAVNKIKLASVKRQISFLRDMVEAFKTTLKDQLMHVIKGAASIITKNLNKMIRDHKKQLQSSFQCQKCEHTKQIVDKLTKQCWDLQQKHNIKTIQIHKMNQQLSKFTKREQNSIKRIQTSLLQQRGQIITKLKRQIQQVKQENQYLYNELKNKDQQKENIQNKYKNSLISLKRQIDSINQTYTIKIQRILNEKARIENQNYLYQQRCQHLQQNLKKQIETRRCYQQKMSQTPNNSSMQLLQNSFNKKKNIKKSQKLLTLSSNNESIRLQNYKNTGIDLKSAKSIQLYHQNDSIQNTERNSHYFQNNRLASKNKYFTFNATPKLKKYQEALGVSSMKKFNNSDSSFDLALFKLNEIQKDVRREINRSKLSSK